MTMARKLRYVQTALHRRRTSITAKRRGNLGLFERSAEIKGFHLPQAVPRPVPERRAGGKRNLGQARADDAPQGETPGRPIDTATNHRQEARWQSEASTSLSRRTATSGPPVRPRCRRKTTAARMPCGGWALCQQLRGSVPGSGATAGPARWCRRCGTARHRPRQSAGACARPAGECLLRLSAPGVQGPDRSRHPTCWG